jgi:hypothetical protein
MIRNPVARGGMVPLSEAAYRFMFDDGWGQPEAWGRWLVGRRAGVELSLEPGRGYRLVIQTTSICPAAPGSLVMQIVWNEVELTRSAVSACPRRTIVAELPQASIDEGLNKLWVVVEGSTGGEMAGQFAESPQAILGLTSIEIIPGASD